MRISDWSSTCALPIWTGGFANAYPHVQPFVAIDDVVAGVAANGVAAIATEDDVAGVIGGHPDTEHGLKPRPGRYRRRRGCFPDILPIRRWRGRDRRARVPPRSHWSPTGHR